MVPNTFFSWWFNEYEYWSTFEVDNFIRCRSSWIFFILISHVLYSTIKSLSISSFITCFLLNMMAWCDSLNFMSELSFEWLSTNTKLSSFCNMFTQTDFSFKLKIECGVALLVLNQPTSLESVFCFYFRIWKCLIRKKKWNKRNIDCLLWKVVARLATNYESIQWVRSKRTLWDCQQNHKTNMHNQEVLSPYKLLRFWFLNV